MQRGGGAKGKGREFSGGPSIYHPDKGAVLPGWLMQAILKSPASFPSTVMWNPALHFPASINFSKEIFPSVNLASLDNPKNHSLQTDKMSLYGVPNKFFLANLMEAALWFVTLCALSRLLSNMLLLPILLLLFLPFLSFSRCPFTHNYRPSVLFFPMFCPARVIAKRKGRRGGVVGVGMTSQVIAKCLSKTGSASYWSTVPFLEKKHTHSK